MHDIHLALRKLIAYCDAKKTTVEQLKNLATASRAPAIDYHELINELTEICTECRQTRESTVFDNTHDSWEYFAKIISVEHLLAFFTGLIDLAAKEATNTELLIRKVSMTACRTYVLLLTSPGAKIYDAFEPDLLRKIFKVFDVSRKLDAMREHERVQVQMLLIMLLEDFQLYLKHVSFEDYEDLQMQFIETIAAMMEFNHEKGFRNKCKWRPRRAAPSCLLFHGIHGEIASFRFISDARAVLRHSGERLSAHPRFGDHIKPVDGTQRHIAADAFPSAVQWCDVDEAQILSHHRLVHRNAATLSAANVRSPELLHPNHSHRHRFGGQPGDAIALFGHLCAIRCGNGTHLWRIVGRVSRAIGIEQRVSASSQLRRNDWTHARHEYPVQLEDIPFGITEDASRDQAVAHSAAENLRREQRGRPERDQCILKGGQRWQRTFTGNFKGLFWTAGLD